MNKNIIWQTIIVVVLGATLVFGLSAVIENNQNQSNEQEVGQKQEVVILLTVEGLYEAKEVSVIEGESVLDMLKNLDKEDKEMQLVIKEYEGLGTLVAGMHGVVNGANDEYWQYTGSGEMPQVGAGAYALSEGDAVVWYFGVSEF